MIALATWIAVTAAPVPADAAPPKRARPAKEVKGNAIAPAAAAPAKPDAAEKPAPRAEPAPAPDAAPPERGVTDDLGAPPEAARVAGARDKLSPLTPEANEFPAGAPPPSSAELDRLLGDIAALRSRVAALTTTLFKSRLRVVVETRGDDARVDALGLTLDDGVVFSAPDRFSADDERVVYEHAVAPGHHVIGLEIERYDVRNRQYRTWQTSKFAVLVPENQLVEAHFVIEDDSAMAADFPDAGDGEYDLRVRLRARVTE